MNIVVAQRDNSIDILRFIGLTCIMLAHIEPPEVIFQLRTFDVPFMVFISALAYAGRALGGYGEFLRRRLLRLVVPVYIFLGGFFLCNFLSAQMGIVEQIPPDKIVGSLFLQLAPSIKYVWIIRIFLIVMLLTPVLVALERRVKSSWQFIALITALFVGQYYMVEWLEPAKQGALLLEPSVQGRFIDDYILYLAYSIPFLVGLRIKSATKGSQWLLVSLLAVGFVAAALYLYYSEGEWLLLQRYKYPPQPYFLLWGTLISSLLWVSRGLWLKLFEWHWVYFIAQNTIWIYLWHIPFVDPSLKYLQDAGWFTRLVVVYGIATLIVYLQSLLVDYLGRRGWDKRGLINKYFKG